MSQHPALPHARGLRQNRLALLALIGLSLVGLAFSAGATTGADDVLARALGSPTPSEAAAERNLVEPSGENLPEALLGARAADNAASPRPARPATALRVDEVSRDDSGRTNAEPSTTTSIAPSHSLTASNSANDTQADETSSTLSGSSSATAQVEADRARTTTTTALPRTTAPPTTQRPQPTTTAPPATTTVPQVAEAAIAPSGWVSPSATGHRISNLHQLSANDGPHGVTIDQNFIDQNAGAPWLSSENGVPVVSGVDAAGLCLNIRVTIVLRDSSINCPTRVQNDSWGYAGQIDDAPAINITNVDNVVIEYNTVRCSGSDAEICSRSVRVRGANAIVQYNDLSLARGAVSLFDGTVFQYNYAHDLAFGYDPTRAHNPHDNVTHNNVVNNLGYRNTLVKGNYIDASYGRVSSNPSTYTNPHFHGVYANGVVEVGDPINGFVFTNYLVNGDGDGHRILNNYVEGAGRPFRCNSSATQSSPSCADDISGNAFAQDRFNAFEATLFEDADGASSISGSCNVRRTSNGYQVLPSSAFGNAGTHQTSGC